MLDVYVGNLSCRVSADDLRELFDGVLGRNTFGLRKVTWTNALIALLGGASWAQSFLSRLQKIPQDTELSFKMVDAAQGQSTRYCLVSGYTRSSATRLIRQLEGAGLQGRALDVHPFQLRFSNSDPRRAGWRFHRWLGVERRVAERRHEK